MTMNLHTLGEKGLLKALTKNWSYDSSVLTGVGDDSAVLAFSESKTLLFKTDAVVSGIHFDKKTPRELIGRKALARALSDIAAMGGVPWAALITLGLPARTSLDDLRHIYRGLKKCAKRYRVNLVGGEMTRSENLFISISLLGFIENYKPVLRSTAQKKDEIWVTGKLGATRQRKHLYFEPRLREGQWLAKKGFARAMMDLSDGLGADLPRMAEVSKLHFEIDSAKIPRTSGATLRAAWNDGEDYELLFAVAPSHSKKLKETWPFKTPITSIGKFVSQSQKSVTPFFKESGYDHFKKR